MLAQAQGAGTEWFTLNVEVKAFYFQGNYARAVVVAKQALEVAQTNFGPDHPNVAASLNNLAELYRATGRMNDAEKLEACAKKIRVIKR